MMETSFMRTKCHKLRRWAYSNLPTGDRMLPRLMKRFVVVMAVLSFACERPPTAPIAAPAMPPPPATAPTPATPEPRLRDDVVVTGGVHGNEPSGAAALEALEADGFRTFGPCNPWGLANASRYLENGSDLNRSFARSGVPEVDAVKAFLQHNPPGLLLDLHEDGNAAGAYLIQHGPDDDLGARIVEALRDEVDFDPAPTFQVIKGRDGVLKPGRVALAAVGFSRFYGLAFYAWQTFGVTTFVVEVPRAWPADQRRSTHIRIAQTARRLFSSR